MIRRRLWVESCRSISVPRTAAIGGTSSLPDALAKVPVQSFADLGVRSLFANRRLVEFSTNALASLDRCDDDEAGQGFGKALMNRLRLIRFVVTNAVVVLLMTGAGIARLRR
jgi:hypothetical protein